MHPQVLQKNSNKEFILTTWHFFDYLTTKWGNKAQKKIEHV